MISSRDEMYHLQWYGQVLGEMSTKKDVRSPVGIRPSWDCASVNGIPPEEFMSRVAELIGYLPEVKILKSMGENYILLKTEEDALAFKIMFAEGEE